MNVFKIVFLILISSSSFAAEICKFRVESLTPFKNELPKLLKLSDLQINTVENIEEFVHAAIAFRMTNLPLRVFTHPYLNRQRDILLRTTTSWLENWSEIEKNITGLAEDEIKATDEKADAIQRALKQKGGLEKLTSTEKKKIIAQNFDFPDWMVNILASAEPEDAFRYRNEASRMRAHLHKSMAYFADQLKKAHNLVEKLRQRLSQPGDISYGELFSLEFLVSNVHDVFNNQAYREITEERIQPSPTEQATELFNLVQSWDDAFEGLETLKYGEWISLGRRQNEDLEKWFTNIDRTFNRLGFVYVPLAEGTTPRQELALAYLPIGFLRFHNFPTLTTMGQDAGAGLLFHDILNIWSGHSKKTMQFIYSDKIATPDTIRKSYRSLFTALGGHDSNQGSKITGKLDQVALGLIYYVRYLSLSDGSYPKNWSNPNALISPLINGVLFDMGKEWTKSYNPITTHDILNTDFWTELNFFDTTNFDPRIETMAQALDMVIMRLYRGNLITLNPNSPVMKQITSNPTGPVTAKLKSVQKRFPEEDPYPPAIKYNGAGTF